RDRRRRQRRRADAPGGPARRGHRLRRLVALPGRRERATVAQPLRGLGPPRGRQDRDRGAGGLPHGPRGARGGGELVVGAPGGGVGSPEAAAGAVRGLESEPLDPPYFRAGSLALGEAAAISRLSVRLRGGAGRRWSIAGSTAGLQVADSPGELRITAADLPRPP